MFLKIVLVVEYYKYAENNEFINDLQVFENKILITTSKYISVYIYNEQQNEFSLLCCNFLSNINNNICINEKYNKSYIYRNMFDFVKVISKKYMTLYNMINSKNLIYIASLKFINNIKFIFENKLFYNIMGYNLNINKDENILESVRKYHKFYSSYFVVDKKYNNIFNIYYTCLKDKNEKFKEVKEEEPNVENQKYNYFYDENRHIEICYDLMLFFQLLIIAKEINKKNYYNIMNIKKWKSYLKKYIYNNTAEKNNKYDKHNNNNNNNHIFVKYINILNIFIDRIFISLNKKFIFFKSVYKNKSINEFLLELKFKVFNRLLKLNSYEFSDGKNAIDILNDIYEQKCNRNMSYFFLMNVIRDHYDSFKCQPYNMKYYEENINNKENIIHKQNKSKNKKKDYHNIQNNFNANNIDNISHIFKYEKYIKDNFHNKNNEIQQENPTKRLKTFEYNMIHNIKYINKYRMDNIYNYNDIIKNNVKDKVHYKIDFYHFIDKNSFMNIKNHNINNYNMKYNNIKYHKIKYNNIKYNHMQYNNKLLLSNYHQYNTNINSLYFTYLHFFIYITNHPYIFFHIKKYLHFHNLSTNFIKNKIYYFNMDLLNIIFNLDSTALEELKNILTFFPSNPSIDEIYKAVYLLSMPFCNT
ncbi:hypothetical protein PFTANZ_02564 [Plasmodium falciparum Tanzania (2000708)]|uniref:Uncharacterized protein n=1 Tax=Plasmodium falciparum Tanzania (2000708) TaxID=1036725 RepID=A0A024W975_PLAFA|nr:hypothetical protein PFTANZ_02564 [Plasmodium falciparum Tanzania (2000708)]